MWKSRKGDLPGWVYVIALIIGIFVLFLGFWIIAKSGQKQVSFLEQLPW